MFLHDVGLALHGPGLELHDVGLAPVNNKYGERDDDTDTASDGACGARMVVGGLCGAVGYNAKPMDDYENGMVLISDLSALVER